MCALDVRSRTVAGPCLICGHAGEDFLRVGNYVQCPSCRGAARIESDTPDRLERYWRSEDFWSETEILKRKQREPVFREAFDILSREKPLPGSVLDIGCGIGTFLAICRDHGWRVSGVDPSPVACDVARQGYGVELTNATFPCAELEGRSFDAVFAAQVLHHLPDPGAFLSDVARVVKEDGVILIRTPNLVPQRAVLKLQGLLNWKEHIFCGPALHIFHPETLRRMLAAEGFDQVSFVISRPYLETPRGTAILPNLRRILYAGLKIAVYAGSQALYRASGGKLIIGPSVFVVARRTREGRAEATQEGGTARHLREVVRNTLSFRLIKSVAYSFAYYIHEQVAWRRRIHAGEGARIHATASIRYAENVHVGRNSHINHNCCVWAGSVGKIVLGEDVLMGPGVCLFAANHGTSVGRPMMWQERMEADIVIGDDVWLGANSVVTAGTRIANGVIVAAGAVVTKNIDEENAIVGGIPARVIGRRK